MKKSSVPIALHQLILFPFSLHHLSIGPVKCTVSVDHVLLEGTNVLFPVYEYQRPNTILRIISKLALILHPVLRDIIKILVVEGSLDILWILIVNSALSVERIILPFPFVGKFFIWIVQLPVSVHRAKLPISIVDSSVRIRELACTMAKTVLFLALVDRAVLVVLGDVLPGIGSVI